MITIPEFKKLEPLDLFAEGTITDNEWGINMTGSGRQLRFVAVKGYANDWAVYVHFADYSADYIRDNGQKVVGPNNIRRCVPCDDSLMRRYRY